MQALIVVWKKWDHLTSGNGGSDKAGCGRAREYAFRVVRNKAVDETRRAARYGHADDADADLLANVAMPGTATVLDILEASDYLSDRQQLVLSLDMLGYSAADISAKLGLRESTTRTHLAAARRIVREALGHVGRTRNEVDEHRSRSVPSKDTKPRRASIDLRAILAALATATATIAAAFLPTPGVGDVVPLEPVEPWVSSTIQPTKTAEVKANQTSALPSALAPSGPPESHSTERRTPSEVASDEKISGLRTNHPSTWTSEAVRPTTPSVPPEQKLSEHIELVDELTGAVARLVTQPVQSILQGRR
jgi:hypothetical protein